MGDKLLEINLFGACVVRSTESSGFEITGVKHRALLALLTTAPNGRRTRAFIQDCLWGESSFDGGSQSLRRALSDIKFTMGGAFADLIQPGNSDIAIDLSKVIFTGDPSNGEFLEGIDIKEDRFNEWLLAIRANPESLRALFGESPGDPGRLRLPSIAVIPAIDGLGSQDCHVLGDWLAAEVSRTLARSSLLTVISHLSTRAIASRFLDIGEIRKQLKVDYCLYGTVREAGDEIVFDTEFVDTVTGEILWSHRFNGKLIEFLMADAPGIAMIVRTVARSIRDSSIEYLRAKPLNDVEDHRLLISGVGLMHRQRLHDFARAREVLEELIRRCPRSADAHAWMGKWYVLSVFNNYSTAIAHDAQKAVDQTARALDIDPNCSFALTIDGFAHNNLLRRLDIANARYSEALRLNPNEALAWVLKGMVYAFTDQSTAALEHVQRARQISPLDPFGYFYDSLDASAQLSAGNFSKALDLATTSLEKNRTHISTFRAKVTALHNLGRQDEAEAEATAMLERNPGFTVSGYLQSHPAADYNLGNLVAEALLASGIPKGE